jgi:hypothetical protein
MGIAIRIKRTVAENYDIVSWILCLFLGGTINVGILNATYNYSNYYFSKIPSANLHYGAIALVGFIALSILMPIIVSCFLTAIQPELRIVPPFFIALISSAWIFVLWITPSNVSTTVFPTLTVGVFYSSLGYIEDPVVTYIFGRATERDYIYFQHIRAYATIEEVKDRIMTPEIRRSLTISESFEGDAEHGYLFKTRRPFPYKNDIFISRDKDYSELTSIKVTYYEVKKYNLQVSNSFLEESHKTSRYIEDIFTFHEPSIPIEIITPFTNQVTDKAIDRVLDDMRGYYSRSKRFSITDRLSISLLVAILFLTAILFFIGEPAYAVLSIAIEVLIAVLELPDILRRQRED